MTGATAIPGSSPAGDNPAWARIIIGTCLGIRRGERVLIAVDEALAFVRDALLDEASRVGPFELWSYTFTQASRPFVAFPERLIELAREVDAAILLLANLDAAVELPAHVAARGAIAGGNARYAVGAYIDQGILEHELSADYNAIAGATLALAARLQGAAEIHLTSPLGTDIRLSVAGRDWRADTGLLRGRGVYGNLPAGEVYVAPLEESAAGTVVVDLSLPGMLLQEPVRMTFERGRVVRIEGGAGADSIERAILEAESKPNGEWARGIAELGIGTNPNARLQGNIITDEKVAGTAHVAIGRNDMFGGRNPAPLHIDGVIGKPTLRVDGTLIIDAGELRA